MRLLLFSLAISIGANAQPKGPNDPKDPKQPQPVIYNTLGIKSAPSVSVVSMELYARFQHKVAATKNANDKFDININSPKSVNYLPERGKFYVQSLEGNETVVYDLK